MNCQQMIRHFHLMPYVLPASPGFLHHQFATNQVHRHASQQVQFVPVVVVELAHPQQLLERGDHPLAAAHHVRHVVTGVVPQTNLQAINFTQIFKYLSRFTFVFLSFPSSLPYLCCCISWLERKNSSSLSTSGRASRPRRITNLCM